MQEAIRIVVSRLIFESTPRKLSKDKKYFSLRHKGTKVSMKKKLKNT
jgi:hypothetical protein